MARRNKGLIETSMELAARLPWWLSLALAGLSYWLIHPLTIMTTHPPATGIGDMVEGMGAMLIAQYIRIAAGFGQYLVPVVFLFGALGSVLGRAKRRRLYQDAQRNPGKANLEGMTWREFEMLIGEWFRRQGYTVRETNTGPDGGVDLVISRDGETYLVQCKQWKAYKVGVNIARELLGVMISQGAAGGYLVTSGAFTEEAKRFADSTGIQLIDGTQLAKWIKAVKTDTSRPMLPDTPLPGALKPTCPNCGADMKERQATRGTHAGQLFWGCSRYPKCRGTLPR